MAARCMGLWSREHGQAPNAMPKLKTYTHLLKFGGKKRPEKKKKKAHGRRPVRNGKKANEMSVEEYNLYKYIMSIVSINYTNWPST